MRVLVVYESVSGHTRTIAESVAAGVTDAVPDATVRCLPAARMPDEPPDVDLVVVGGPTHFFGLPGERTRRLWVQRVLRRWRADGGSARLEPGAAGPGLREWFAVLPQIPPRDVVRDLGGDGLRAGPTDGVGSLPGDRRPWAAAFDTRLDRPVSGSAARRIARLLRRHGYRVIARPEGFLVEDTGGPLRAGERERAARWGSRLAVEAALAGLPRSRPPRPEGHVAGG